MVNLNRRHFLVAGLGTMAVAGLAGCQQDGGGGSTPGKTQDAGTSLPNTEWERAERDAVAEGGLLRLAMEQVPDNWNSDQANGNNVDTTRVRNPQGFGAWLIAGEKGELKVNPDYITEAKLESEDPQVVSVKFNDKAVWEDGSPITIDDLISYQNALKTDQGEYEVVSVIGWQDIEKVEKISDFEGKIHYKKKFADWIGFCYPSSPKTVTADAKTFNTGYVDKWIPSCGPYKVANYDKTGGVITLEKNDKWWGEPGKLDQIVFKVVSQEQMPSAFANGELDAIDVATGDVYDTAAKRSDAVLKTTNGLTWTHLTINTEKVADVELRKAMAYAINRPIIAQAVIGPLKAPVVLVNNLIFMPGQEGYEDTSGGVKHDPAKAAEILTAAGYEKKDNTFTKDGKQPTFAVTVPSGVKSNTDRALQVQKDLNALGLKVEIKPVPSGEYFKQNVNPRNFDMVTFSWQGGTFAVSGGGNLLKKGSSQNYTQFGTDEIDALISKSNETFDVAERNKIANELSTKAMEAFPIIPFYATPNVMALKNGLVNYGPSQFETVFWENVGFKK